MTRTALVLGLVLCLLAASPATAAPPWEPPREPATVGCKCPQPWQLAFGTSGRALAVVQDEQGSPILGTRTAAGVWNQVVPPVVGDPELAVHGDRALLFGVTGTGDAARAKLASGTTSGKFGKPRDYGPAVSSALAVDPSGAALAAWSRPDGALMAIRRAPGKGFSKPIRVGRAGPALAAAVNRRGEAVVMWRASKRQTVVRAIDSRGRPLDPVSLGPTEGADTYAIGLADRGRWVAAWQTHRVGKTGSSPNYTVQAFRGTVRGRTATSNVIDKYADAGGISPQDIRVKMDSTGRAIVAWSSAEFLTGDVSGTRFLVKVASGSSDGRLGEPQTVRIEDEGVRFADLETGPDGRAVLLWSTIGSKIPYYEPVPRRLLALYRARHGEPFGPHEQIDTLNDGAAVAFDPVSGRPLAIWDTLRESFRG